MPVVWFPMMLFILGHFEDGFYDTVEIHAPVSALGPENNLTFDDEWGTVLWHTILN